MGKKRANDDDVKTMSLWDHLEELRWTIFKSGAAVAVTTGLVVFKVDSILEIVLRPISQLKAKYPDLKLENVLSGPFDGVLIKLKLSLLLGVMLGLPFVILFFWSFVSPGLKSSERKAFVWICGAGTLFFATGMVCGYLLVFPILSILMRFSVESAANLWNLKDFVTFMFYWLLGAGVVFEMPLAMVVLARLGVVNVETLRKVRPYFLIGAFVVAAIITPPDPFTMAMVGVPLVILYEIGILAASIGATAIPNDEKTGK